MSDAARPGVTRAREELLVRLADGFVQVSVDVYDPPGRRLGTIFCLHDLVGNGRDFVRFATDLVARRYRVVCPDMPGRGGSAFLADARAYNTNTYQLVLMQVMEKYAGRRIIIVGKGWGGLLALQLIGRMQREPSRLVLADVPLEFTIDTDIAAKQLAAGPSFATAEAARAAMLDSGEFAGLDPEVADELAEGRLRRTQGGYAVHFDPALLAVAAHYAGKKLDLSGPIGLVPTRVLHMSSGLLSGSDRAILAGLRREPQGLVVAEGLAPEGRIHFTTDHQLLLVHGFLSARPLPPPQPAKAAESPS